MSDPVPGPASPQPPLDQPDLLDFAGRTVVLTGAASGMGAATLRRLLDSDADVIVLDRVEVEAGTFHQVDLGDPSSIQAVVAQFPSQIDVLVNCAGIPNGGRFTPEDVMRVNWLGLRLLTELTLDRMSRGSSVVHVASTAGRGWPDRVDAHQALMASESFTEGLAWIGEHADVVGDGYAFSKETVQFYTLWRSVQLLSRGIRMNSVCPGITATGIIDDFRQGMGSDVIDHAQAIAGRMAQPDEMAPAILFLADNACSSYITGNNLNVDHGTAAARLSGQNDPQAIWPS